MKITRLNTHNLKNDEYYQFFIRFRDEIQATGPALLRIEALFATFLTLMVQLDAAYGNVATSALTEEIDTLDRQRNEVFRGIKDAIKAGRRHFTPAVKDAARKIAIVADSCGNIPKKGKSNKTAALTDFLNNLLTDLAEEVAALAIGPWLQELGRLNSATEALMRERFDETTARSTAHMREVRLQIDAVYYAMVERVEAFDVTEGTSAGAPWAAFMASLNTVIDYTGNIVAMRKGRAKAKKEKNDGTAPEVPN